MDSNEIKAAAPSQATAVGKAMNFSERLKGMMTAKGLSAKRLGHAIGLTDFTVGRWVKGKTMPTIDQAILLDKYLGSTLVEDFKNDFRPPIKGKAPGPKKNQTAQPREKESIKDFLKGFGDRHPDDVKPKQRATPVDSAATFDDRAALGVLLVALECLKLILQPRPQR